MSFKLDAGFARSRFTNQSDTLPEQGLNLMPARETTRSSRFADASLVLLRDVSLNSQQKANLNFNFRHCGRLSGFALPVLRYFVGASESQAAAPLALISPAEGASVNSDQPPLFTWVENQSGSFVQLEVTYRSEQTLLNSLLPVRTMSYRAPSWLREKAVDGNLRWRIALFDQS